MHNKLKTRLASRRFRHGDDGFTLLEVLIGISILTVGVLIILMAFPQHMKSNEIAELRTIGAALANMKIEELRRDNDENDKLINAIRLMTTPTEPIPFSLDQRLAYQISNETFLYRTRNALGVVVDDPDDPRDDPGVPRIIVLINPEFRPGNAAILDEYRFNL